MAEGVSEEKISSDGGDFEGIERDFTVLSNALYTIEESTKESSNSPQKPNLSSKTTTVMRMSTLSHH